MRTHITRLAVATTAAAALALSLIGCQQQLGSDYSATPSIEAYQGYETTGPLEDADAAGGAIQERPRASTSARTVANTSSAPAPSLPPVALTNRMMIFNVSIRVRVKDFRAAAAEAEKIAARVGGFVSAADIAVQPDTPSSGTVTLRVPTERLDEATGLARKLGEVLAETRTGEDVTSQAVDIQARLKNLRASEESLRAMLAAARRLEDKLDIEQRVTAVRGDIESMEAQYRSLATQAALATLTITLGEQEAVYKPASEPWSAATIARQAWDVTRAIGRGVAAVVIWLLMLAPIWLPMAAVVVLATRLARFTATAK